MNRILSSPVLFLQKSFRIGIEKIAENPKTSLALVGLVSAAVYYYRSTAPIQPKSTTNESRPKRGFSGVEQLYFDISIDLDTAPNSRHEIFENKLKQLLSTAEYLLNEAEVELAIKYFSTASGLAVIMSDLDKANALVEHLMQIYSPKLSHEQLQLMKFQIKSEMKLGQGLRQNELEQNQAEIDEISPSVLKQIENMPKRILIQKASTERST